MKLYETICFMELAKAGPIFAEGVTQLYIFIYRSTNETNSVTVVRAPILQESTL